MAVGCVVLKCQGLIIFAVILVLLEMAYTSVKGRIKGELEKEWASFEVRGEGEKGGLGGEP